MRLLLLIFFLPCLVKGQPTGYNPGFIVTNNNDTLHGLVKNKEGFPYQILKTIKFKESEQAKPVLYPPDSLREFTNAGVKYSVKYLSALKKKCFFKLLIDDYLMYYELEYQLWGASNFDYYVILQRKNEEESLTVLSQIIYPFKKKLTKYLKDDPDLCSKIRTRYYHEGDLKLIVKAYNKFIAEKKSKE